MDVRIDDVDRKILAQLQRDASQSLDDYAIEVNKADIKINGKAIEYLEAKSREVQVANDNPLFSN